MSTVLPQQSEHKVPQGTLKMVELAKVHWDDRFRNDFGDIDGLTESVREKGLLQPITITPDFRLLAGERRVRACRAVGLEKVPALVRKIEGEIDAREIEMMENLYRKNFSWAEECRGIAEIDKLYKEKDLDWSGRKTAQLLDKSVTGVVRALKLNKIITVMPELAEMKTADEALKTVAKLEEQAITTELAQRQQNSTTAALRQGSVITTEQRMLASMLQQADGNYRVGDTFKGLAELRTAGVVHIIECDPPYGIELNKVKASKDTAGNTVDSYQEVPVEDYPQFLVKLTQELYRVAAPNAWLIFWFGPSWQHEVLTTLREAKWLVDEIPGIWIKRHGQTLQPELYMARAYEPFYLCRKGTPVLVKRGRINVFDFPGDSGTKKFHPTQRPVTLVQELLEMIGVPRNIVLVPFLGSGNTLRAAYNAGMSAFGWDLNAEYKPRFMLNVEADTRALSAVVEEDDEDGPGYQDDLDEEDAA